MPTKAYSYLRFSSPAQMEGDSLRRQLEASQRYAKENHLDLDTSLTFHDLGVSALGGDHRTKGKLGALITAIDTGRIATGSFILVESLDRLSREDVLTAMEELVKLLRRGVYVVTLQDNQRYSEERYKSEPMSLMQSILIMQRAHEESETKSRRVKAAWDNKRALARRDKTPMTPKLPYWLQLNKATNEIEEIPERADIIRWIYDQASKPIGGYKILHILNERGVPTFGKSTAWYGSYIQKILKNRSVYGLYQPYETLRVDGKKKRVPAGEPIENFFPVVVSRAQFERVREIAQSKRLSRVSTGKHLSNLFTGVVHCGHCPPDDNSMAYINKSEGLSYLVCSRAQRGAGCKYHSWRYPFVEEAILKGLRELDLKVLVTPSDEETRRIETLKDHLYQYQGEREDANQRLTNIINQSETIPVDQRAAYGPLLERIPKLTKTIEEIDQRIAETTSEMTKVKDRLDTVEHKVKALGESLDQWATNADISPDELYERRSKLAYELKGVIKEVTFYRHQGDGIHGQIMLTFHELPYARTITVGKKYRTVEVLDAEWMWPPDGLSRKPRGLTDKQREAINQLFQGPMEIKGYHKTKPVTKETTQ